MTGRLAPPKERDWGRDIGVPEKRILRYTRKSLLKCCARNTKSGHTQVVDLNPEMNSTFQKYRKSYGYAELF